MYTCLDKYAPENVVFQNEGLKPRVSKEFITQQKRLAVAKALKQNGGEKNEFNG